MSIVSHKGSVVGGFYSTRKIYSSIYVCDRDRTLRVREYYWYVVSLFVFFIFDGGTSSGHDLGSGLSVHKVVAKSKQIFSSPEHHS